jgi:hypothetical protein
VLVFDGTSQHGTLIYVRGVTALGGHEPPPEISIVVTQQLLGEIADGEGEPLARAVARLPSMRQDRAPSFHRIYHWVVSGAVAPNGSRVYLEAVKSPSGWLTSAKAVQHFSRRADAHDRRGGGRCPLRRCGAPSRHASSPSIIVSLLIASAR